jgi:FkbM family methyltransferase
MTIPKGFRLERGLLWPAYDTKCARVVFKMANDLDVVMRHVGPKPKAVVQAGGNCGVWARALAPLFETVYTFEPDPMNFTALTHNVSDFSNVVKFQAALGFGREHIKMGRADFEVDNCGAMYVEEGGVIPTLRIDDLNLRACELLYLDIEGYEVPALFGAVNTIRNCKPIIAIEDKGLSEKYGYRQGEAETWLAENCGYVVLERVHKDVVFGPPR